MRRKQTKLENNLYELGYRLDHKTYCGKKSDKVLDYVFIRTNGYYEYQVYLNRERTKIEGYCFTNPTIRTYNDMSLGLLQQDYENFKKELDQIYDFENQVAKDCVNVKDVSEFENPFVEESAFDD